MNWQQNYRAEWWTVQVHLWPLHDLQERNQQRSEVNDMFHVFDRWFVFFLFHTYFHLSFICCWYINSLLRENKICFYSVLSWVHEFYIFLTCFSLKLTFDLRSVDLLLTEAQRRSDLSRIMEQLIINLKIHLLLLLSFTKTHFALSGFWHRLTQFIVSAFIWVHSIFIVCFISALLLIIIFCNYFCHGLTGFGSVQISGYLNVLSL